MQTISQILHDFPVFRQRLCAHQIVQSEQLGVGLVIKLPNCGDQVSVVRFENAHLLDVREIARCIEHNLELLTFCYHKSVALLAAHSELKAQLEHISYDIQNAVYIPLRLGSSFISLSNIGHWGFESVNSPLFPGEAFKFTLGKIERKQVWNNASKQFEVQDILPVGLSVDHRVFDANVHVPKIFIERFEAVFAKFVSDSQKPYKADKTLLSVKQLSKTMDYLLEKDRALGFQLLFASTFVMDSHIELPTLLANFKILASQFTT